MRLPFSRMSLYGRRKLLLPVLDLRQAKPILLARYLKYVELKFEP